MTGHYISILVGSFLGPIVALFIMRIRESREIRAQQKRTVAMLEAYRESWVLRKKLDDMRLVGKRVK